MSPAAAEKLESAATAALVLAVVAWVFAPYLRGDAIVAERDALSAVLPAKLFLARSIARGEIPWWNPLPVLGKPFFADPLPGVLYPGNLLLLVPPFARGYDLFLVGQYLWTAIGAVLCLRAVGLPRIAAAVGALVWTLGGALISLGNVVNHLSAVVWLPWVFYGWSRPTTTPARIACAALAMAPAFLAGSPEMVVLIAGGLVLWSADARALLVPLLAAGLAAVEVVPILAYLGLTHRGAVAIDESDAMHLAATFGQLVQIVWAPASPDRSTFLGSVYVGPVALGLAALGLSGAPRRRAVAIVAAAILIVLVALGPHTPVLPFLFRVAPLAGLVRYPGKAMVALHALIACGAAFGMARLLAWGSGKGRAKLGRQAIANLAPLVAVVAIVQVAYRSGDAVTSEEPDAVLAPPAVARAMRADANAGDGAFAGEPIRYYSNTTGLPPTTSRREALRLDRALLLAATGELFDLGNVNTPSSLNLVAHEILQKALASASRDRSLGALAALGTRYVTTIVPFATDTMLTEIPLDESDPETHLYRLAEPAARVFFARRVTTASDALGAAGRFVMTTPGRHAGLAVLDGLDAVSPATSALLEAVTSASDAPVGTTRWLDTGASELSLLAEIDRPALLVVNDTWVPGWSATVDGAPTDVLRVNGLVRGIALGAGRHHVEMRYRPPGLREGLLLSIASGLCVVLLLVGGTRRRSDASGVALSR